MADLRLAAVIRYLHRLAEPSASAGQSDAVLLGRLAEKRDPAAFETLLRRHGPLVWRVCRRILHREQDAEDAFQATFLALARQVKSIRKPESLTSFLHGTAYRIARRLQEDDRRRSSAREIPSVPVADPSQEASWRELGRIIEEEVHVLPEKLRAALLLCYWEGLTNEEAARRLGCPCGTLKARLAKARKLLHDHLIRRGVTLPAGTIALLLAPGSSEAAVPSMLAVRTANMAGASPRVAALVEGGLRSMTLTRVKIGLVLLALGTVASGIGVLAHRAPVAAEKENRDARTQPAKERPIARTDLHGDPLPERALARLGTTRWRMGGLFFACAYSPDGKTLAAASADHTVTLFDVTDGKPICRLRGHQSEVTCIAYSPDGRTLASGCAKEGTICIWEPATGKLLRQFHAPRWPVWSLIFSRDGKSLFSGGEGKDSPIIVWDPATGKEIRRFDGPKEGSRSLALSPDGRTVASNSKGEVQLWEAATGKLIRSLTGQKKPVRALAFSSDGKPLATGSEDTSVWLWETATGEVSRRLPEKLPQRWNNSVRALAFSPDGKTLVVGAGDHSLRFWDVATGKKLREMSGVGSVTHTGFHDGGIQCLAFSPDGRRLAFGQDNRLALLDVQSGEEVLRFEGHRGEVQKVFFGPDGKHLITVSNDTDRHILEWDSTVGRLIRHVPGKISWANQMSFSPGRTIMASVDGATLLLRDVKTGKEIRQFTLPLKKASTAPNEVVFSADGKWLAIVEGLGQSAWLLDAATGKQVWSGRGTTNWTFALARFSADGRLLAMVGNEAIQFVELPSGQQLLHISLPKNRTTFAAALSPDGRTLALASGAWTETPTSKVMPYPGGGSAGIALGGVLKVRAITLWETATGKERRTLPSPYDRVNSLVFSPDGRLLALGGNDQLVHLCDTAAGKWVKHLEGHQGEVKTLTFSPDGRRLASGSHDTTALIWDVTGLATKKRRPDSLPRKELEALWSTLAAADAAKAYQTILTLETLPEQAVPFLAEHLHRRSGPDTERIAGLVKQLDSEDFATRQRAAGELRKLHWAVESALRKVLEEKPSLEVRKRAQELLGEIFKTEPSPPLLQDLRAVEVLERIGTTEAKEVLRELADRAPETRLTREAKASLDRLARP